MSEHCPLCGGDLVTWHGPWREITDALPEINEAVTVSYKMRGETVVWDNARRGHDNVWLTEAVNGYARYLYPEVPFTHWREQVGKDIAEEE